MCFSFCKYEKEKLTLLSQNLVQQKEQKLYFSIERYKRKTSFSPTKLSSTHSPPYDYKTVIFHSFWTFSEVKKLFSEASKCVIGKKLLGSNRPYMSYPMKFCFYLHQAYGY